MEYRLLTAVKQAIAVLRMLKWSQIYHQTDDQAFVFAHLYHSYECKQPYEYRFPY